MRPHARLLVIACAGLAALILAGPVGATEPPTCELDVEPREAPVGSTFQLIGAGYSPTQVVLQQEGGEPVTIELEVTDDPFSIPVGSGPGDEGMWTATVAVEGTSCSASVTFRVTLHDTAVGDHVAVGGTSEPLGAGLYLAVIVTGLAGGLMLGRRFRTA